MDIHRKGLLTMLLDALGARKLPRPVVDPEGIPWNPFAFNNDALNNDIHKLH